MRRRPIDTYIRKMHQDRPTDTERRKLIVKYRRGGIDFEEENIEKIGTVENKWGPTFDTNGKFVAILPGFWTRAVPLTPPAMVCCAPMVPVAAAKMDSLMTPGTR